MEASGRNSILLALVTLGLILSSSSLAPAARSDTATCVQACNNSPIVAACNTSCDVTKVECREGCAELKGNPDRGGSPAAVCNEACTIAFDACRSSCSDLRVTCKAKCPRGKVESPTDPAP